MGSSKVEATVGGNRTELRQGFDGISDTRRAFPETHSCLRCSEVGWLKNKCLHVDRDSGMLGLNFMPRRCQVSRILL